MLLTAGMIAGGRKPATTTARVAVMSAYSIRSCPSSSRHSLDNSLHMMALFAFDLLLYDACARRNSQCMIPRFLG